MDEFKILIGAEVNDVCFSHQIDINFIRSAGYNIKYANLQIEVPFQLKTSTKTVIIDPDKASTLAPMLDLLHTSLMKIKLTHDDELTLEFANKYILQIKTVQKYEAWNLKGDGIPYYVATGK